MYSPTRDEARGFLAGAWRKYRGAQALSPLEEMAVAVIGRHPEYHALLDDAERHVGRDYLPEGGEANPFLHLSLHLAVAEQLAIDQPPGIAAQYRRLCVARGDEHAALHAIVECLAETLWQAQRSGTAPDASVYLGCLEQAR